MYGANNLMDGLLMILMIEQMHIKDMADAT